MPDLKKPTKLDKTYLADDGANRGPLTMHRVAFHPTERRLLAACGDRRLAVWDLDADVEKSKRGSFVPNAFHCPHEQGWIRGFDVHPLGTSIATGGSDRRLKLWPWVDGAPADRPSHDVAAHDGWVEAVAFSPDGRLIVTAGADFVVKVWDAADLKPLATLTGHVNFCRDVAFTPDGALFVSGAEDGRLLVWDAKTFGLARTIDFGDANDQFGQNPRASGVNTLAISHDGRFLAAAGGQRTSLYRLADGAEVAVDKLTMQVAFSRTLPAIALGSNSLEVRQYDESKLVPPDMDAKGKTKPVTSLPGKTLAAIKVGDFSAGIDFSRDGKSLALGKADGSIEIWQFG